MDIIKSIWLYVLYSLVWGGISVLLLCILMWVGNAKKKIEKNLRDTEKLKGNSHRALNDIEKIKQFIRKEYPDTYDSYWRNPNQ